MPFVVVHVWEGRTVDQKRRLVQAITDAMIEHVDANPSGLHVAIQEYPRESWGRAGVLGIDRTDPDAKPATEPRVFGVGHVLLQVSDLDAASPFYLDFLGFEVRKRDTFEGGRPLLVTVQGLGLTTGGPAGGSGPVEHIAFRAKNVEAVAERAKERGVEIIRGPEPSSYGISLYLRDLDGNKVELFGDG